MEPDNYAQIMGILEKEFGLSKLVVDSVINKLDIAREDYGGCVVAVLPGAEGTASCTCIGSNGQLHNEDGTVMTTKSTFINYVYPGDYGESCKIHAEPGQEDCRGGSPLASFTLLLATSATCLYPFCL